MKSTSPDGRSLVKKREPEMSDGRREEREPYSPSGYHLEESGVEYVVLRRPDGSEVAVYSAEGADPKEIEERAWDDFRARA